MTPNERTGGIATPGPFETVYPTKAQDTPRTRQGVRKPTDRDRVLAALRERWVCAVEFNNGSFDRGKPILRYTARFHDLRQEGWYVERRKCENEYHDHDAPIYQWRIPPAEPEQTELFGGGL